MKFKEFLLEEGNQYFGSKIGDILNALQELSEDSAHMGTRHLIRLVESIGNEIRAVLRSRWTIQQRPYLETLQKVGVALMKAIDEKGDLPDVLKGAVGELQKLSEKIGTPVNQMGTDLAENVLLG